MSMSKEQQQISFRLKKVFESEGSNELEFSFPDFDTTGGYSADIICVCVNVTGHKNKKQQEVIVKKNKANDIVLSNSDLKLVYSTEINLYSEIVQFYRKFVEKRNGVPFDNIPHCFGTVCDEGNYILFLENLAPKGFRLNNLERLMDSDQAKLVLKAYGTWHAINLACKDQEPEKFAHFEELMSPKKAVSICELFVNSMVKEMDDAIELFRKKNCTRIVEKLECLKEKYPKMYRDCFFNKDETYVVVRHADCWNNNFLFHYGGQQAGPDKAIILDWQLSFIGSPLADVAQFIFYSCHQETIRQTDDLLQYYYHILSKKLRELGSDPEECLPWAACQQSFQIYAPLGVGGVPLNIRFRHKTDVGEEIHVEEGSLNDGSFNVLCGKEIRDVNEYFETMKGILELSIEKNFI